jgi:uncharacterized protein
MEGRLSFFEIGVGDSERGRAFYEGLFGWDFEVGPSGGHSIETPGGGGAGVPGGIHGGDPGAPPLLFFEVADIDAAVQRVGRLGGEVLGVDVEGDEDSVAEFGRFRICRDDQGSPFGLHQPPRTP